MSKAASSLFLSEMIATTRKDIKNLITKPGQTETQKANEYDQEEIPQSQTGAGSTRLIPVLQGCPRCRHDFDKVHYWFIPDHQTGMNRTLNRDSEKAAYFKQIVDDGHYTCWTLSDHKNSP